MRIVGEGVFLSPGGLIMTTTAKWVGPLLLSMLIAGLAAWNAAPAQAYPILQEKFSQLNQI